MLASILRYLFRRRKAKPNPPTNFHGTIIRRSVPPWFVFFRRKHMSVVVLTWTDPTERVDSTPDKPDLIAPDTFTMQILDSASPTPGPIGTVAGGVQTFTTGPLASGIHTFQGFIVDSEGNKSDAAVFSVTISLAAPKPATNFTGVVQ